FDKKVFAPHNPISIELEKRGYLFSSDLSEQMYPHCSYCKQPLIIKSNDHWHFELSANHLRQRTIKAFNSLEWFPSASKKGIRHNVEKYIRWNISKRRIYGIPIPVFYCCKCDSQLDMNDSVDLCNKLIEQKGTNSLISMKPEDILSYDTICNNCGENDFRLESDILSSDFISVLTYKSILANQKSNLDDIDLSLVSNNQNGKWDSLSLSSSMAIEGQLPFKSVIKYGHIKNDGPDNGKDESIINLVDIFGADMVRLCAVFANPNKHIKISEAHVKSISKPYIHIRNVLRFILGNLGEFDPKGDSVDYDNLHEVDKWILHKLAKLVEKSNGFYENHQFHRIHHSVYSFIIFNFSKIYVSIVRRRLYSFPRWSLGRRSVQTVFHQIVSTVAKLIAPILPFTAEEIWDYIPGSKEEHVSIYLSNFPGSGKSQNNDSEDSKNFDSFESNWNNILKIRAGIYRVFEKNHAELGIKNLSQTSVTLYIDSEEIYDLLFKANEILAEIFMVSKATPMPPDSPRPDDLYVLDGIEDVSVEIKLSAGSKCERCLIYSTAVGTSEQYPTLCDRCIAVLEGEASYA
ncbi:MAG: class I tRNA ligase family protein, partial [Candidatus Poribacteria bacterium]